MVFSWVDDNVVKNYINEASDIELLSRLWTYERNEWINNMKQIGGDEYTSHTKYWPKYVIDYYQWFYFKTTMCEF